MDHLHKQYIVSGNMYIDIIEFGLALKHRSD